jgi:hypothetical protein
MLNQAPTARRRGATGPSGERTVTTNGMAPTATTEPARDAASITLAAFHQGGKTAAAWAGSRGRASTATDSERATSPTAAAGSQGRIAPVSRLVSRVSDSPCMSCPSKPREPVRAGGPPVELDSLPVLGTARALKKWLPTRLTAFWALGKNPHKSRGFDGYRGILRAKAPSRRTPVASPAATQGACGERRGDSPSRHGCRRGFRGVRLAAAGAGCWGSPKTEGGSGPWT